MKKTTLLLALFTTSAWISNSFAQSPVTVSGAPGNVTRLEAAGGFLFVNTNTFGQSAQVYNGSAFSSLDSINQLQDAVVLNGKILFAGSHKYLGQTGFKQGLWETDGTNAGTKLIKDFTAEGDATLPKQLKTVGNLCFFWAYSQAAGYELWKTDGTTSGTQLIKDMCTGSASFNNSNQSHPDLVVYNNKVYVATQAGTGICKGLWETDGTEAGTKLYYANSNIFDLAVYNGALYFSIDNTNGRKMCKASPSPADTSSFYTGANFTVPGVTSNAVVYRAGNMAFYKTDGTAAGTKELKGSLIGNAFFPRVLGNTVIYKLNEGGSSQKIYYASTQTDSSGELSSTIRVSSNEKNVQFSEAYKNKIYFNATEGNNTQYLYETDGSKTGTKQTFTTACGMISEGLGAHYFKSYKDALFFICDKKLYRLGDINNAVATKDAPLQLAIYPNPTTGKISFGNIPVNAQVDLYNLLGERMYSQTHMEAEIDLSGFAKGIYLVRVSDSNSTWTGKLILE